MKLLFYPTNRFGISRICSSNKFMNIEVCEILTQAKFALILVQKWPFQNEFIDLGIQKISINYHIKSVTFQTHVNKSYPLKRRWNVVSKRNENEWKYNKF
jgi:hypothetical protein